MGEGREAAMYIQSLLCTSCRIALREKYDVPYAQCNGGCTRLAAYLRLVKAVRFQAEIDNKLCDFESYWIQSAKWHALWDLIKDEIDKHAELCAVVRRLDI